MLLINVAEFAGHLIKGAAIHTTVILCLLIKQF